jgi:hypothetical protein
VEKLYSSCCSWDPFTLHLQQCAWYRDHYELGTLLHAQSVLFDKTDLDAAYQSFFCQFRPEDGT